MKTHTTLERPNAKGWWWLRGQPENRWGVAYVEAYDDEPEDGVFVFYAHIIGRPMPFNATLLGPGYEWVGPIEEPDIPQPTDFDELSRVKNTMEQRQG